MLHFYQKGVGLIEVLVSLFLMAFSVLGFVALQANAIQATDESLVRTKALTTMRDLADRARYNKGKLATYARELNGYTDRFNGAGATPPSNQCGISAPATPASAKCNFEALAKIEAYLTAKEAFNNGYQVKMHKCPDTDINKDYMTTYCMIASWGDTTPIFSDTDTNACMSDAAVYKRHSDCVVMEML